MTAYYWLTIVIIRTAGTNVGDFLAGRDGLHLGLHQHTSDGMPASRHSAGVETTTDCLPGNHIEAQKGKVTTRIIGVAGKKPRRVSAGQQSNDFANLYCRG